MTTGTSTYPQPADWVTGEPSRPGHYFIADGVAPALAVMAIDSIDGGMIYLASGERVTPVRVVAHCPRLKP